MPDLPGPSRAARIVVAPSRPEPPRQSQSTAGEGACRKRPIRADDDPVTEHAVVIIDAKTEAVEKIKNVGLFPWGTHIMDSKDNYCH